MSGPAETTEPVATDGAAATAEGGLSKSKQKQQAKQAAKEAEKAKKAAAKAAAAQNAPPSTKKQQTDAGAAEEDDSVDPDQYYESRISAIKAYEAHNDITAYPHKFHPTMSIPHFVHHYTAANIEKGQQLEEEVSVAGRIYLKRSMGQNIYFYDLYAPSATEGKLQVVAMKQHHAHTAEGAPAASSESTSSSANTAASDDDFNQVFPTNTKTDFYSIHQILRRGDIIGVTGRPGRSNTGELSLFPTHVQLLSPCLRMLPSKQGGLKDQETRYRQRYLDLMLNTTNRNIFYTRSRIIAFVRRFLDQYGFLEVETPMMNIIPGGAAAKPFKTHHNDLKLDMFMRIAPELYLKMLVIGGMERVYEIGKQFRNEGIDLTHNPEFTTCEFYWAYADFEDLIQVTEEMISTLVHQLIGKDEIVYQPDANKPPVTVSFKRPWKRINFIDSLEQATGVKFPTDLHTDKANKFLSDLCLKNEIPCPEPRTTARLLDKMIGHYVEDTCISPTFICEHPAIMSPLSKVHRQKPHVVERFELFILTKEICNAYTELNMPAVQRQRFAEQAKDRAAGDDEAQAVDEDFCRALDYGLPPTAGWGMGIDRLTMFLTNQDNIKEVLLYPAMKPVAEEKDGQHQASEQAEKPKSAVSSHH